MAVKMKIDITFIEVQLIRGGDAITQGFREVTFSIIKVRISN